MATRAKERKAKAAAPTPMMAQYFALKEQAPDCLLFFRMGDFYELFFDDARAAAASLDIALTSRGEHEGEPVPMCGVPVASAESYLARLIKAGHRVAIAEQTESPAEAKKRGHKALVARDIVRIVTAGTLTEEALLDSRAANWLAAVAMAGGKAGIAAADISTGRFELVSVDEAALDAEFARIGPSEIVLADGAPAPAFAGAQMCRRGGIGFDSVAAEKRLKERFGVATLDGFGEIDRAMLAAAGGLLCYLEEVAREKLPFLRPPRLVARGDHMGLDAATRESLELVRAADGGRAGSLIACVDRTATGPGARLLAADIAAPLLDRGRIEARLDLVALFEQDRALRERLRRALGSVPDIGRALGRIAAGRGTPRDLGQLRDGLEQARRIEEVLAGADPRPTLLGELLPRLTGHGALADLLARALVPSPPTETANGGYIAAGYDAALDALRAATSEGRRAIAGLETRYRKETGIAALKIRHNAVLGYHVEVPAKHGDKLMAEDSGFTHRQTLAGVVRFNSPDLHQEAMRVAEAGAHALAAEAAHLEELIDKTLERAEPIAATADALARLDVASALAERAAEDGWCRPHFAEEACFEVEGGRHPVVEEAVKAAGQRFIANDCALAEDSRLWLVTGPNMGGKSTFLRQNALIVLLAQAGSYVPASAARLGLVDRLFSRVGASDNLARGRSTFMVEMVETAAILSQATGKSFVILDEIGRGTSTYDGLAIAWAVTEAIHDGNRCRCLFATHYHELTRLAERLEALSLHHVRAREWQGELVLLHEVAEGPADRSYGLAVAKLAGLPKKVLARGKAVLEKLEAGRAATGGIAAGLDDLPLFAAAEVEEAPDALREAIGGADIDGMSPREALDFLYSLKRLAAGDGEP